jgi:hypothetical protein
MDNLSVLWQWREPMPDVCQQLMLDERFYIVDSDDGIFHAEPYRISAATEWSSFFASIQGELRKLTLESPELRFERVETVTDFLHGIFDCTFMLAEWGGGDPVLVWTIHDYSDQFQRLQAQQQSRNEHYLNGLDLDYIGDDIIPI